MEGSFLVDLANSPLHHGPSSPELAPNLHLNDSQISQPRSSNIPVSAAPLAGTSARTCIRYRIFLPLARPRPFFGGNLDSFISAVISEAGPLVAEHGEALTCCSLL